MKIEKVWLTDDAVWIRNEDGVEVCEYFKDYPRLRNATAEQRGTYKVGRFGISWPEIDEDLSFEGFFKEKPVLFRIFMQHPELNASAVARKIGIPQSLFARYISGVKKPSEKRMTEILSTIRSIGEELASV